MCGLVVTIAANLFQLNSRSVEMATQQRLSVVALVLSGRSSLMKVGSVASGCDADLRVA